MPKAVSYAQGAIIFFSGDRDDHIYIVQSGLILNQEVDIETGQQITEKLKPGEFFGVKSTLARMPHMVTAYAATDSVVIVMSLQEFEKLFANKRDVTEKMLRVFSKTLREIHHKMQSILHNDAVAIPQDVGMMMVAKAFYDDDEFFSCASVLTRLLEKMPDAGNKEAAEKLLADAKVKAEQDAHNKQTAVSSVDTSDDASLKQFSAPIFQQFNPFYVVALTPVSMAIFTYLANKGKEPSAPRKIAYGMLVAGAAFFIMLFASQGLNTPNEQAALAESGQLGALVSPYWLISTYLVLTFGELLLSPMGISFVSKVAPPKYKGLMMGGWFGATAIGNKLVSVGGYLWGDLPLWVVWTVFIAVCLAAAIFMFAMMKRLEKVAK